MKVKCLNKDNNLWLDFWIIYSVFSIEIWKDKWEKYYIKPNWTKYIYPFDIKDFEIVDSILSSNFSFWINKFWDKIIWPIELLTKQFSWEDYYNDVEYSKNLIDKLLIVK